VISILPVDGLPEIDAGDDLAALIVERAQLEAGDVVVVAQKVVSKAEARVIDLADVEPSDHARELAGRERDPRESEVILRESVRVVRSRNSLVIAETSHGFVCASAGVDHSNAATPGTLILLPVDPDESAQLLRTGLRERTGFDVPVVVTDSFGRPFRKGTTDVAIGVAGIEPLADLRGTPDRAGRLLRSSQVAIADELAAAADLARRGKDDGLPVVIVRGYEGVRREGSAQELVISAEKDLFR
jgi:coenzyme F420-0:L-glutamate ligase / coenzyme F420-1:gamma-L-glutamate ligase